MPETLHLLGSGEVATLLDKDIRSVHRMVARGEIPTVGKLPGRRGAYLFDYTVVMALVSARSAARRSR